MWFTKPDTEGIYLTDVNWVLDLCSPRCELDKNLFSFNNTKTENVFIFVPIYQLVSIQPVQPTTTKSRSKRLHFRAEVILILVYQLELQTKVREDFTITKKALTSTVLVRSPG